MANALVGRRSGQRPKTRAGFVAKTAINRQEFGVSWNDKMDQGGIVVSNIVEITIDAEAILETSD